MAHSLCQLAVHLVFGLKHHQRYLDDSFHPYIAGIIRNCKADPIVINGTEDHVHILSYLPRDMSIAEFVRVIKSNSSKWHNEKGRGIMHWQTGYAAFSVSHSNLPRVQNYIMRQKERHKQASFHDEMKDLLQKVGLPHLIEKWTDESE